MTATSTATPDLATMLTQVERAQAEANAAAARAAEAQAKAQAVAGQIAAERDTRFVAWAEATVAAAPDEERRLIAATDAARIAFERGIAEGEPDYPTKYLDWSDAGGKLFHHRQFLQNVRGNLAHRRPDEHAAPDASRHVSHDSRVNVPPFVDALSRAVAQAVATRNGDHEDALQDTLSRALRGEDPAAPDRRDG